MQELFVGVSEVAERLGVSSDTVTRWCRQGRIPGIKPGRDWRVPASVALVASPPASPSEWLIRWVGRLGTETLATEGSVARAAEDAGRVIFCLLPLAGDPDLVEHDPDLAGLVEAHTHNLVGQAHGRSWLGSARAGARLAGVS